MQRTLTEQEIDQIVISQANDESAWEEPIQVRRDATTSLSIPADLAAPLRRILDAELAIGNAIQEISSWPPKCQLLISLKYPFRQAYEVEKDVTFLELNDLHYWKSEYHYLQGVQTLVCGFGKT
jgi:hypothetical protein